LRLLGVKISALSSMDGAGLEESATQGELFSDL
jgi:hypothetical protein